MDQCICYAPHAMEPVLFPSEALGNEFAEFVQNDPLGASGEGGEGGPSAEKGTGKDKRKDEDSDEDSEEKGRGKEKEKEEDKGKEREETNKGKEKEEEKKNDEAHRVPSSSPLVLSPRQVPSPLSPSSSSSSSSSSSRSLRGSASHSSPRVSQTTIMITNSIIIGCVAGIGYLLMNKWAD